MKFSLGQLCRAHAHTDEILKGTIRGWFLSGEKRTLAVHYAMISIEKELENYGMMGVEAALTRHKDAIATGATERFKQNPKCEFAIFSIILMAIISWLIQKLLDWIFTKQEHPR